jgi:3-oxoacyl-[acyl-carrier protein] reductase
MHSDFSGKTVLVTGSSRGIGKAIAFHFASLHARVVIHYNTNREAAEQALGELPGADHLCVQADLRDPEAVRTMVEQVISTTGRMHVLVNNAGVFIEGSIAELTYDKWLQVWDRTIHTNLMGAANACFCAAKHMIEQGGGKIINVSSRGAYRGEPNALAYGASKGGLSSFTQSLAKACAPYNILVYAVAPSFVETEMTLKRLAKEGDAIRGQSPLNRLAQPEEIARTVAFLAGEGTDFLTGGVIDINGASYLR